MKKLLAAGLLAMLAAQFPRTANAERPNFSDPQRRDEVRENRLERLTKELGLTTDQQARVKTALNESGEKMETLRKESADKARAIREDTDEKIAAALTDDQKKKYEDLKEKREEKREQRRHNIGDKKRSK